MKKHILYLIACLFLLFSCKNENNTDVAIHTANSFISEIATTPQALNGLSTSTINAKHHALISWNIKDFGQTKDDK